MDGLRSTIYGGHARAEQSGDVPTGTFESTWFGSGNLLWSSYSFLTVLVGFQIF